MNRQTFLFLFLATLLISCSDKKSKEVGFYGYAEEDTVFLYQNAECHFVTAGLVESLLSDQVASAKFTITTTNFPDLDVTLLTKDNYYLSDTMNFELLADLNVVDDEPEKFDTPAVYYSFFGELEVYYQSGDTLKLRDTITVTRVNPLASNKMVGELLNGQRNGQWLEFYDVARTKLARKSYFESGLRQGTDTMYRFNEVGAILNWKDGRKHGLCRHFRNGFLHSEVTFNKGIPTTLLKYYDSTGEVYNSLDLKSL